MESSQGRKPPVQGHLTYQGGKLHTVQYGHLLYTIDSEGLERVGQWILYAIKDHAEMYMAVHASPGAPFAPCHLVEVEKLDRFREEFSA